MAKEPVAERLFPSIPRTVSDTGPINYLVLIGLIDLLRRMFGGLVVPTTVAGELQSDRTPLEVRQWILNPPAWFTIVEPTPGLETDPSLAVIDAGERAAICLSVAIGADLLLMDDRKGAVAARKMGLKVTGTLGVLDLAADRGLIDFAKAVADLEQTNFRRPTQVVSDLLPKHRDRRT